MSSTIIFSMIMVLAGFVIMVFGIIAGLKIKKLVPAEEIKHWSVMTTLMFFFLIGYGSVLAILTGKLAMPLEILVGMIFMGGAMFVLFMMLVARGTLQKVIDREREIKLVNQGLFEKNQELCLENAGRKKAEAELCNSVNRFRAVMDGFDSLVYVADMETYEILFINKFGKGIWGEVEGQKCWQSLQTGQQAPCDFCTNKLLVEASGRPTGVYVWEHMNSVTKQWYECRDQAMKWVDGRVVRMEIATDISHRKEMEKEREKLQEQLVQAQKMEAVGRLTGGIAHDFNNLLTAIMGYSQIALLNTKQLSGKLRHNLEMVYEAGEKAAELTKQLLAFSRKQKLEIKTIDLNTVIENIVKMLNSMAGEGIKLNVNRSSSGCLIKGDRSQLEQIIMNLVVNARDAVDDEGHIEISTEVVELCGYDGLIEDQSLPDGSYVKLMVADNGAGIPEEVKNHMFEPFFTTKEEGKGTGLGLATVYGIVRQHSGGIRVESKLGEGTSFELLFPREKDGVEAKDEVVSTEHLCGEETLLIVDDDPIIRCLLVETMASFGYKVYEAAGPDEAINSVNQNRIDMVVSDVVMPGKGGLELVDEIMEIHPEIKVIFMSGYTSEVVEAKGMINPDMTFISKPVTPAKLAAQIRAIFSS